MNQAVFKRAVPPFLLAAAIVLAASAPAEAAIPWHDNLAAAKRASNQTRRPVLVIFTASWSEESDRFIEVTVEAPEVIGVVSACFEPVRLDVDSHPELARRLVVTHVPTACVIDANEQLLFRFACSSSSADFVAYAARAIQHTSAARVAVPASHGVAAPPRAVPSAVDVFAASSPYAAGAPVAVAPAVTPLALPALPGSPGPVAAQFPTTSFPAASLPPSDEKPKSRNPFAAFFESAAKAFKPAPPKQELPATPPAPMPLPDPQMRDTQGTVALGGAGDAFGVLPVCLDGCCPVTLREKGVWFEGNPQYGARHRGRTYLFAGPLEQQAFLAAPDRYAPALAGDDPVLAMDLGRKTAGQRIYGVTYESRVYLFASPETRDVFSKSPERYAGRVAVAENSSPSTSGTILR